MKPDIFRVVVATLIVSWLTVATVAVVAGAMVTVGLLAQ